MLNRNKSIIIANNFYYTMAKGGGNCTRDKRAGGTRISWRRPREGCSLDNDCVPAANQGVEVKETERGSPSADAVSNANLKEIPPMVLARLKRASNRDNSNSRKLKEMMADMESRPVPLAQQHFRPQRVETKRRSTSGQTWEVDVRIEWVSSQQKSVGQQITSNRLEKSLTKNTASSWWISLVTIKEWENCLKKLDRGVSTKRRSWPTQQNAEMNKLELRSQLGRTWENICPSTLRMK